MVTLLIDVPLPPLFITLPQDLLLVTVINIIASYLSSLTVRHDKHWFLFIYKSLNDNLPSYIIYLLIGGLWILPSIAKGFTNYNKWLYLY